MEAALQRHDGGAVAVHTTSRKARREKGKSHTQSRYPEKNSSYTRHKKRTQWQLNDQGLAMRQGAKRGSICRKHRSGKEKMTSRAK
eukprot:scaffold1065_cov335-Pinguiococcus_pyrenoidosus.AAC.3